MQGCAREFKERVFRNAAKFLFFIGALGILAGFSSATPRVIYGKDDRLDVYQVKDLMLAKVADATVALVPSGNLTPIEGGYKFSEKVYGEEYRLCKDEPFFNQPNNAFCSGFLIGEDLLATAGHCIEPVDCASGSAVFVFNYKMTDETTGPREAKEDDVYRCKKIVAHEYTNKQDYTILQLDRPVVGHKPLKISDSEAQVGDEITVIGHPAGLPTKISGGASVREVAQGFFVSNLDTYGGNSGSVVISNRTLDVVGILVRGERDFVYDVGQACNRSKVCEDQDCRGEDSTQISYLKKALQDIDQNQN